MPVVSIYARTALCPGPNRNFPNGAIVISKTLAMPTLALCCFAGMAAHGADVPASYDYPYKDPWLATASVALLKDPKLPEKQVNDAVLLPARARTPLFENKARVYYVTYRQERPADLVVLISGLGSVAEDPLALYLGGQIFAMGYNVIVVPDAFNWQFALGASSTGYVGIPSVDAADLESFILRARDHAVREDGMKIRATKLVGYSMGALEGAFLAAREAQSTDARLKLDKVVLLNPPVDTFYDLHMLDSLAATGATWSSDEKKTVKARAFKLVEDANLTDPQGAPYFRDLGQRNTLTDDQLKFVLFGLFRDSLRDVIMVTQQIRDLGILKTPADATHLDAREREAGQYGFEDYLARFLAPQFAEQLTAPQGREGETLYGLEDFLASHREVEVFHNADDFLVRPQDLDYLQQTLGNRLTLFPHGGHMGNIWYPANQQMLAGALGSGPVPPAAPAPTMTVSAPIAAKPGASEPGTSEPGASGLGASGSAAAAPLGAPPAPTETAQTGPAPLATAPLAPPPLAPPPVPEPSPAAVPVTGAVAPPIGPASAPAMPAPAMPAPAMPAPAPVTTITTTTTSTTATGSGMPADFQSSSALSPP